MRLSEVRDRQAERQLAQHVSGSGGHQNAGQQTGQIRNSTAYARPIEALYEGQPVLLIATGDIVGMSPAVQIVDETGRIDWVSSEDVTVIQRDFLPQSDQTRNRLRSNARQSGQFANQ